MFSIFLLLIMQFCVLSLRKDVLFLVRNNFVLLKESIEAHFVRQSSRLATNDSSFHCSFIGDCRS